MSFSLKGYMIIKEIRVSIMEIRKELNNKELTIYLSGDLNSSSAPELDEEIRNSLKNVQKLVFDFSDLAYVSSAGLRILLVAQKIMSKQGEMIIRHPNQDIMEVFTITGFTNILTIEN